MTAAARPAPSRQREVRLSVDCNDAADLWRVTAECDDESTQMILMGGSSILMGGSIFPIPDAEALRHGAR